MFRPLVLSLLLSVVAGPCLNGQGLNGQTIQTTGNVGIVTPTNEVASTKHVIGPDDSITIVALDSDELSKTWRVNTQGDLNLPLVGKVHAAGKSTEELEDELTVSLKRFIRNPQITVFISDLRSQSVTVSGAVDKPGIIPLDDPKPLIEVLTLAGGAKSPSATVTISRPASEGIIPIATAHTEPDGEHTSVELELKDIYNPVSTAANLKIRSGDVITVLDTPQRLVYIIGDVTRPGSVELVTQERISLMQVLAAAGGLGTTAAPGSTRIMHKDAQGLYGKSTQVDLKKILSGKGEDQLLSAGDIVVVPYSKLKSYRDSAALAAISSGLIVLTRF